MAIAAPTAIAVACLQVLLNLMVSHEHSYKDLRGYLIHASEYPYFLIITQQAFPPGVAVSGSVWAALGLAVTVAGVFTPLVLGLRAIRSTGGTFGVALLGWGCTALGVGAGVPLFTFQNAIPSRYLEAMFLNLAEFGPVWILLWAWVGALVAAALYRLTALREATPAAADRRKTCRTYKTAAIAAAPLVLLMLTLTLFVLDHPKDLAFFPDPLSYSRMTDPGRGTWVWGGWDLVGLFVLQAAYVLLVVLTLGSALRAVRPRRAGAGVFALGWSCAVLACGGVGLLREAIFNAVGTDPDVEQISWGYYPPLFAEGIGVGIFFGWLVGIAAVLSHRNLAPVVSEQNEART
ncbi:hypothetical protein [Nonomuraea rubra]|uniref:Uncharacterized protein n=2 Tax=Nonomuraea rubra TaxID=46180 RepID=A0A7X0NP03_9ACTN|nr:hypothetical protein [Nonomuraea rubra]MBB6546937.1 hypothetical protein [Nonomuraea rubra]